MAGQNEIGADLPTWKVEEAQTNIKYKFIELNVGQDWICMLARLRDVEQYVKSSTQGTHQMIYDKYRAYALQGAVFKELKAKVDCINSTKPRVNKIKMDTIVESDSFQRILYGPHYASINRRLTKWKSTACRTAMAREWQCFAPFVWSKITSDSTGYGNVEIGWKCYRKHINQRDPKASEAPGDDEDEDASTDDSNCDAEPPLKRARLEGDSKNMEEEKLDIMMEEVSENTEEVTVQVILYILWQHPERKRERERVMGIEVA